MLGGTGKTGRRVARAPARARPAGAARLALGRAAVRLGGPLDLGARAARRRGRLHLLLPRPRGAGRRRRRSPHSPSAAVAGGTRRLVLLSGRGEEEAQRAEERAAGVGRRVDGRALQLVQPELQRELLPRAGRWRARWRCRPTTWREPFVDADDIADVAVAALTEDGHAGRGLRADRPAAADLRRRGRRRSRRATGRECATCRSRSRSSRPALAAQGVPADVVALLRYLFTEVLDGRNAHAGRRRAAGARPRAARLRRLRPRRGRRGAWRLARRPSAMRRAALRR